MGSEEINKKLFSFRLTALMDDNNETVYTLGEKLHLSPGTISRYKQGKIAPKITTIEVLSRMYGVNPAWLMGYDVEKSLRANQKDITEQQLKDDERIMLSRYREINEEDKQYIQGLLGRLAKEDEES